MENSSSASEEEAKGTEIAGPEGAVYFVLKSGRYQGETLYATEHSERCLAVAAQQPVGASTNTSVIRREWVFSRESGLLTLVGEGDDKVVRVRRGRYLFADGLEIGVHASWTLSATGVLSLADGRQLFLHGENGIMVAMPGEDGNSDPTMREWGWMTREEYEVTHDNLNVERARFRTMMATTCLTPAEFFDLCKRNPSLALQVLLVVEASGDESKINSYVNYKGPANFTPLIQVGSKHFELVQKLVALGADVNAESEEGEKVLNWATMGQQSTEILKLLVQAGARQGDGYNSQEAREAVRLYSA
mmetsp:Transcript_35825/g.65201  ORF Transcript_35825/g.65201 Transcript_35825/m.65201 type:complete len:304 (+) Transcript_35825:64-975(+)